MFDIQDIKVLGYDNKVNYVLSKDYLKITIDKPIDTKMPICFDIMID